MIRPALDGAAQRTLTCLGNPRSPYGPISPRPSSHTTAADRLIEFTPFCHDVMPNSASAKKRLRQSQDRRAQNRSVRSALRTQIRKVRAAVTAGDADAAEAEFKLAARKLDQAASKNVLHANATARTKSRLSKAIKGIKAGN